MILMLKQLNLSCMKVLHIFSTSETGYFKIFLDVDFFSFCTFSESSSWRAPKQSMSWNRPGTLQLSDSQTLSSLFSPRGQTEPHILVFCLLASQMGLFLTDPCSMVCTILLHNVLAQSSFLFLMFILRSMRYGINMSDLVQLALVWFKSLYLCRQRGAPSTCSSPDCLRFSFPSHLSSVPFPCSLVCLPH